MATVSVAQAADYAPEVVEAALDVLLEDLGLDPSNPFAGFVHPGQTVFVKPNWVAHRYRASCAVQDSVWSTITHPQVIRAVVDRIARALAGSGSIIVGDNPSIDADFPALIETSGLADLQDSVDVPVSLVDLRPLVCTDLAHYGQKDLMVRQPGDPAGGARINLGRDSMLHGLDPTLFRGVFTDTSETVASHSGDQQWYELSGSIVGADVYFSLPKLKTHHKVGTTLNLKGLVGTVLNKNQLVHWRTGFPAKGGDEYPDESAWRAGETAAVKKRGAWPGNDTIWRMVVDLYTALLMLRDGKPNFTVIDGITGGQGEGPFCPRSKQSGVLLASGDLLAADLVASRLMGFDVTRIPYLNHYLRSGEIALADVTARSRAMDLTDIFERSEPALGFEPPAAWRGTML